jgi:hypothetical protein
MAAARRHPVYGNSRVVEPRGSLSDTAQMATAADPLDLPVRVCTDCDPGQLAVGTNPPNRVACATATFPVAASSHPAAVLKSR